MARIKAASFIVSCSLQEYNNLSTATAIKKFRTINSVEIIAYTIPGSVTPVHIDIWCDGCLETLKNIKENFIKLLRDLNFWVLDKK